MMPGQWSAAALEVESLGLIPTCLNHVSSLLWTNHEYVYPTVYLLLCISCLWLYEGWDKIQQNHATPCRYEAGSGFVMVYKDLYM